ncbi:MAG: UDP-N-acetylglucosamine 1-carboxyvinyltransferase [Candidatus Paceibacterota bacterium]
MSEQSKEFLSSIGSLIHQLREEKGVTQQAFAKELGSTQSAVARIEAGQQNISAEMLSRISNVLGRDLVSLSTGALNVEVTGGKKLSGSVTTKTSKNAAVALLAASLLNKSTTTLHLVPQIEEVNRLIEVLESIGVAIKREGSTVIITPPAKFTFSAMNREAGARTRSVILFIGSLIHRVRSFSLPQAGGCKLGRRTIKPHLYALEEFGVSIETARDRYKITHTKKKPVEVILYESGDTVTENALMAAALTPGVTTIKYASANYQVQDLCFFLEHLGVAIDGIGTTTLSVHGVEEINTPTSYTLAEDPIESMFFIAAAAVTRSAITIKRCPIEFLELELLTLEKMGFSYKASKPYFSYNERTKLVDITTRPSKLVALDDKIAPRPYPGLNIDNLPFFGVIATQAEGQTLIHDWVYEDRAIYLKELDKLGAETLFADPHRIYVTGRTPLKPTEIVCPPALRPGAVILIAMLAAEGTSTLRNIYSINRGYEDIVKRLNGLGADIQFLRSV